MKVDDPVYIEKYSKMPFKPVSEDFGAPPVCGTPSSDDSRLWLAAMLHAAGDKVRERMKCIDYGCGNARLGVYISGFLKNFDYYGVEPLSEHGTGMIADAIERLGKDPRYHFNFCGTPEETAFIDKCDVAFLGSVFTHTTIEDSYAILDRLLPIVHRGGIVVFSILRMDKYWLGVRGAYTLENCRHMVYNTMEQFETYADLHGLRVKVGEIVLPGSKPGTVPVECDGGTHSILVLSQDDSRKKCAVWGQELDMANYGAPMWSVLLKEMEGPYSSMKNIDYKPGDVVIDVGAHIGMVSIALAKLHPEIKIIALEPHPVNYADLIRNIYMNDIRNITPLMLGVSKDGRTLTLVDTINWMSTAPSAWRTPKPGDGRIEVETITIQDLMSKYSIERCKVLKLDCEGAEFEVLTSYPDLVGRVEYIYMEIHDLPSLVQMGYTNKMLEDLLLDKLADGKATLTYTEE